MSTVCCKNSRNNNFSVRLQWLQRIERDVSSILRCKESSRSRGTVSPPVHALASPSSQTPLNLKLERETTLCLTLSLLRILWLSRAKYTKRHTGPHAGVPGQVYKFPPEVRIQNGVIESVILILVFFGFSGIRASSTVIR